MADIREMLQKERIAAAPAIANLKHLIIRLRWMGMEDDAQSLSRLLDRIAPRQAGFFWPPDTD